MTLENARLVEEEIKKGGWTIIWGGAEMPCEFLDERVELIYADKDDIPRKCYAVYTYDKGCIYRRPYFRGDDGTHMTRCIAWRKVNNA